MCECVWETLTRRGAMKNAARCNRATATFRNSLQRDGIYQVDWPLARDTLCLPSLILWRALSRELIFRNAMLPGRRGISLNFERRWLAIFQTLVTPGDARADGYMFGRRQNYAPFSSVFSWRLTVIFSAIDRCEYFFHQKIFLPLFWGDYSILPNKIGL